MAAGDLDEFSQCQSKLKDLYNQGHKGHPMEFAAYRILYACVRRKQTTDLGAVTMLSELSEEQRNHPAVSHAFAVRRALISRDYAAFFRLYRCAPNMSAYLMDHAVAQMRLTALKLMAVAYRPSIPVSYLTFLLVFKSVKSCCSYLQQIGVDTTPGVDPDDLAVDCKAAQAVLGGLDQPSLTAESNSKSAHVKPPLSPKKTKRAKLQQVTSDVNDLEAILQSHGDGVVASSMKKIVKKEIKRKKKKLQKLQRKVGNGGS